MTHLSPKTEYGHRNAKKGLKMDLTFMDMFCGVGGFSLAGIRAGLKNVVGYETDRLSCNTYAQNIGRVENVDVRLVTVFPRVDVILASPPLSGLSHLGKRTNDVTSAFHAIYNATDKIRPKHVVIETSPYIVKNITNLYEEIKGHFLSREYHVYSSVLDARDFGVPQHRERLYIIATKSDYEFPTPFELKSTPETLFRGLLHNTKDRVTDLVRERLSYIPEGENLYCGSVPENLLLNRKKEYRNVYRRIRRDKATPTVLGSAGGGNALYHWEENRPLTVDEIRRLQGFPDDYSVSGHSKQKKIRLGMATNPIVAELVLKGLK